MYKKRFLRIHLALFTLFYFGIALSYAQEIREISLAEGLSQATVTSFEKDRDGFMWVGTKDGLNRYDGYSMKVLKSSLQDTAGLSSNHISCLHLDSEGYLWVGTNFGLNRLNTRTFEVKTFFHWFEDKSTLSDNTIRSIAEDRDGNLWIGTANGLNRLKLGSNKFERFSIQKGRRSSLSNNIVNSVYVDSQNRIWVGTQSGLNLLDAQSGRFERFYHSFDTELAVENNQIYAVEEREPGVFWIGTINGIFSFDESSEKFTSYFKREPDLAGVHVHEFNRISENEVVLASDKGAYIVSCNPSSSMKGAEPIDETSLSIDPLFEGSDVLSLFSDPTHLLWLGTESEGIITADRAIPDFAKLQVADGSNSKSNRIYSMAQHSDTAVWVGTADGLKLVSLIDSTKLNLGKLGYGALGMLDVKIRSILILDSLMWLGTDGNGLVKYNRNIDSLTYYLVSATKEMSISSNQVNHVISGNNNTLWVSTQGGGICHFDMATEKFSVYRFDGSNRNSLRDNNVFPLVLDSVGNLWAGTGNAGIYKLNVAENTLQSSAELGNNTLPASNISDLMFDDKGNLWIATLGEGLFVFRKELQKFQSVSNPADRIHSVIHSIHIDDSGRIWKSTNAGISVFDPDLNGVTNFDNTAYVGHNQYYPRSVLSAGSERILFGGTEGITMLHAASYKMNAIPPPVVIVDCQELGMLDTGTGGVGKPMVDSLTLEYNHSGFQVEFAALNFKRPENNHYQYRLVGLFNQWRNTGDRRFATFSNLNPGRYTLEVRASNNDGIWNSSPMRMSILVHPAFWQTFWFRFLAVLAVLSFLYLFYRYRISLEKERRSFLETAVDQRTREIAEERDTNAILLKEVHHRVKNNLQIIASLLNLQSRYIQDPKLLDDFSEIQNRVRSMALIHQKMYQTRDLKTINIEDYIKDLSSNLIDTYQVGNLVDLDVDVEVNEFNSDTLTPLGLLINEIISNSLKYAFEEDVEGKIFVRMKKIGANQYRLLIGDDGIGLKDGFDPNKTDSFGSELISALVEQLNGTIKLLEGKTGTVYQIDFEDVLD